MGSLNVEDVTPSTLYMQSHLGRARSFVAPGSNKKLSNHNQHDKSIFTTSYLRNPASKGQKKKYGERRLADPPERSHWAGKSLMLTTFIDPKDPESVKKESLSVPKDRTKNPKCSLYNYTFINPEDHPKLHDKPKEMHVGKQKLKTCFTEEAKQHLPRGAEAKLVRDPGVSDIMSQFQDPTRPECKVANYVGNSLDHMTGTTKVTDHRPGYTGFIPMCQNNKRALKQAQGTRPRADHKAESLLFSGAQYKHNLPGYSGYRPISALNMKYYDPKDPGISTNSTSYIKHPRPKSVSEFGIQPKIRDEFYHTSNELVSEDGIMQAEKFYSVVRPMEGLPLVYRPSKFTESGYLYDLYKIPA